MKNIVVHVNGYYKKRHHLSLQEDIEKIRIKYLNKGNIMCDVSDTGTRTGVTDCYINLTHLVYQKDEVGVDDVKTLYNDFVKKYNISPIDFTEDDDNRYVKPVN